MNNIFDYLTWRGDISFKDNALNEVDNLIFSACAYIKLNDIINYNEMVSIEELYKRYIKIMDTDNLFKKNQNKLFEMLSKSERFKSIIVTHYFNKVDDELDMQVGGITFILPSEEIFVAFKGTDETITGWKEDFELSYKSIIPAQEAAVLYLNEILTHTKKKVYVGGHSKGGNLAMYASLFCANYDKVVRVFNNDGPGFNEDILNTNNYKERKEKIVTYLPKSSIVGNILNSDTKTIIIKSSGIGILQHNLYSWLVLNNHFIYTIELSEDAKKISNSLNDFINKIPNEQKEKIVSFIYDFFESNGIYNIEDTLNNIPNSILEKYNFKLDDLSVLWKVLPIVIQLIKAL